MKIFQVGDDPENLLLCDGKRVINGSWDLTKAPGTETGFKIPLSYGKYASLQLAFIVPKDWDGGWEEILTRFMKERRKIDVEITSDGITVWVNGSDGCCIGRFSKFGIDVHKTAKGQMDSGKQCCECKSGEMNLQDWFEFKRSMVQHHGVLVDDDSHRPAYLRTFSIEPSRGNCPHCGGDGEVCGGMQTLMPCPVCGGSGNFKRK